jgi:hypothetical protein
MKFAFSTLFFLALASLGLVAAIPLEIEDGVLVSTARAGRNINPDGYSQARAPIIGPCPAHVICGKVDLLM